MAFNVSTQGWRVPQTGDERPFSQQGRDQIPSWDLLMRGRHATNWPPMVLCFSFVF